MVCARTRLAPARLNYSTSRPNQGQRVTRGEAPAYAFPSPQSNQFLPGSMGKILFG